MPKITEKKQKYKGHENRERITRAKKQHTWQQAEIRSFEMPIDTRHRSTRFYVKFTPLFPTINPILKSTFS